MKSSGHFSSRRQFLQQTSIASLGLLCSRNQVLATDFWGAKPDSNVKGVQIGAITYSWRSMPNSIEQIIRYCEQCNISSIELMGDAAEDVAGKPKNNFVPSATQPKPSKEQREAYQKLVADWRASVGMEAFETIRKTFQKAGIRIYAFKPDALNKTSTDAEIEYALKAAKALGATAVTCELPTDPSHSKRLGEWADKHRIYIGYHAHLQATDAAWDTALSQSPYNSMNLDCGHYIAAGGNNTKESLLALIEAKHDRITSMHIKDRRNKENGGANVVWGNGNTPIKEILCLLRDKKYKIPATIELEYDIPPGSDAVKETARCFEYAKKMLES